MHVMLARSFAPHNRLSRHLPNDVALSEEGQTSSGGNVPIERVAEKTSSTMSILKNSTVVPVQSLYVKMMQIPTRKEKTLNGVWRRLACSEETVPTLPPVNPIDNRLTTVVFEQAHWYSTYLVPGSNHPIRVQREREV